MSSSSSRSATSRKSRDAPPGKADSKKVVNCPQCGAAVVWDSANRYRPFCSERCKMIDLGAWATESYRVPAAEDEEDKPPEGSG